jgi:hypothetical protein
MFVETTSLTSKLLGANPKLRQDTLTSSRGGEKPDARKQIKSNQADAKVK